MSLWAELKRRNVFRVGAAYAVIAWFIVQAADIMLDNFGAPAWVFKTVTGLLVLGFPMALFLSWVYELTPEGMKKTADVTASESVAPKTGRRIDRLIVIALLGVIAILVVERVWFAGEADPGASASELATEAVTADLDAPVDKSIAVLPFSDFSPGGDQGWFVDGLTEEILNSLARLPELKVSARTSSFQFREPDRDIRVIAEALDVANVVEGSVRRIDERLRVTVQLIRAADGFHLWSSTYDRTTEDLFEVQRDVAEKIAVTLDVFLDSTKRERMFASGTRNVEAFMAFQKGRSLLDRTHANEPGVSLWDANEELERAMVLDPNYVAPAIAHHDAFAHYLMDGPESDYLKDPRGRGPSSEEDARRRLIADLDHSADNALTPSVRIVAELTKEYFSPTWTRMPSLIKRLREEGELEEASAIEIWLTNILLLNSEFETLRELSDYKIKTNPLDPSVWSQHAAMLSALGEFDAAEDAIKRGRATAGDHPWLHDEELFLAIARRDKPKVLALLRRSVPILAPQQRDWRAAYLAAVEGDYDRAKELAEEIDAYEPWPQEQLLRVYHETRDTARAGALTKRIDNLAAGPAILGRTIAITHNMLFFDLSDAPNFAARLEEAGIDPASFRRMPRLSVLAEQDGGAPAKASSSAPGA